MVTGMQYAPPEGPNALARQAKERRLLKPPLCWLPGEEAEPGTRQLRHALGEGLHGGFRGKDFPRRRFRRAYEFTEEAPLGEQLMPHDIEHRRRLLVRAEVECPRRKNSAIQRLLCWFRWRRCRGDAETAGWQRVAPRPAESRCNRIAPDFSFDPHQAGLGARNFAGRQGLAHDTWRCDGGSRDFNRVRVYRIIALSFTLSLRLSTFFAIFR